MDPRSTSGRPAYLRWWLLPLAVLITGLALTALFTPAGQVPVTTLSQDLSRAHHDELSRTLMAQAGEVVAAARRLNLPNVTTENFQIHGASLLAEFPEVTGVELLTTVTHAQRAPVERQLSAQAGRSVRLSTWTGPRQSQPAEPAEDYLVIRQGVFQSDIPGVPSLGLVATTVPHWREALQHAQREGRPTATTLTGLGQNGTFQRALRVFIPFPGASENPDGPVLLALVILPDIWLTHQLSGLHDDRWQVELHDISQHARQPLATLPAASPPARDVPAIRSTLTLGNRQWLLSTRPAGDWLDSLRQQARWPLWLTAALITLLGTGLTAWACWQLVGHKRQLERRAIRTRRLGQQLDNTRVEKNILHHSLQESDRRTRDLIDLSAGIVAELDERRQIGYLSPQAATLLGIPTTELTDSTLDTLFASEQQRELAILFDAARHSGEVERLDTDIITRDGHPLPVTLRVKAIRNPLSGCTGFRISLTPR